MKSHMLQFFQKVLQEMGDLVGTSTARDYETVARRVEREGWSFLTITLPAFEKGLLKSLDSGASVPSNYPAFTSGRGRSFPRFLEGFSALIFDTESGVLLDEPSIDAIYAIRQVTLLFAKIELECAPHRVRSAFDAFIECESIVRQTDSRTPFLDEAYDRLCVKVLSDLLSGMDKALYEGEFKPSHGPGSTAERLSANQKYKQSEWTDRLEGFFPATEWLLPNFSFLDDLDGLTYREPGAERPVRVIAVPKTLKTPRIIAIEPAAMMYIQQGVLELFEIGIQRDTNLRYAVNGPSQVPNQDLARLGSIDGSLATLDLSEASDRVSNQHVRWLLRRFPTLWGVIDACRSRKADVPGHGVKRLAKFASMGSAVCFPVEALVFLTVVLFGIQKQIGHELSRAELTKLMRGKVRIFGDDIIVPTDYAISVARTLEAFGLKVNSHKSFWTGRFRESCGKEYYLGHDVTVVKIRSVLPVQRRDAREIERTVATRNLLYEYGLWNTVRWLDEILERLIPFPAVLPTSPCLGRFSFLGYQADGWDDELQRPLVRAAVAKRVQPDDYLDGYGALLKYFLNSGEKPILTWKHLERAGRPDAVKLSVRMVPPF